MRRLRLFLIIAILILLVAVGVVVVLPRLQQAQQPTAQTAGTPAAQQQAQATPLPTATPITFVDIVIAVQELSRGQVIPPDAVALRPWPEQSAPFNGITNLEDVVGKIARTDIFREQPILTNMVVEDLTSLARVGSDAAAVLPNGLRAVSLPMDRLTSVAYAVQDGDRVDVIISMLFVDVDEAFQTLIPNELSLVTINQTEEGGTEVTVLEPVPGRPDSIALGNVIVVPSERQRPRLVTQMTIQDALVVHVGNFPPDGRFIGVPPTPTPVPLEEEETQDGTPVPATPTQARPDIITLGVTPQDAVVLTWMIEARVPVTLALRSAQDTSRAPTNDVTMDYIMSTYGIELPGKRPYAIEPAIRSIRQLLAGEQIALAEAEAPAAPPQ